jgi:N-acetylmuramoyl-L-alanine amidase
MDDANLQVAMKENSVITLESDYQTKYEGFDPNSAESYIIFSLMQNTYLKQSTEFATLVQGQFRDRVGRKDRGVRQAGFVVLWRTTMPSVLIELGYITNPEEEKFLMSEQGQDYLASAIYRALRDYKQTIDSRSGIRNGNGVAAGQDVSSGKPDSTAPDAPKITEPGSDTLKDVTHPSVKTEPSVPANSDETFFLVQIAAMPAGRELSQNQLKGIEMVTRIKDGERIKYAAGKYVLYDDALKYRRTLTGRFPDAFVIAVRNGKIVPLREAIEAQKRKQ